MSTVTARSVRPLVFTATLIALPWMCAAQDATVEYVYRSREVLGGGENIGSAHRVQYAVRFNLP